MNLKRIMTLGALSAILLTNSGCVIGALTLNPYIFATGFFIDAIQYSENGNNMRAVTDMGWGRIGILLDEKNPGRVSALNPLPIDQAAVDSFNKANDANVKTDDFVAYNNNLDAVIKVNARIEANISSVQASGNKIAPADLNQIAQDNGFASSDELVDVLKSDKMGADAVSKFAKKNGLDEKTAQIYLQSRFGIKI